MDNNGSRSNSSSSRLITFITFLHLFPAYRSIGFGIRKATLLFIWSTLTLGLTRELLKKLFFRLYENSVNFYLLLLVLLLLTAITFSLVTMVIVLEWIFPLLYLFIFYTAAFLYLILLYNTATSSSSSTSSSSPSYQLPLRIDFIVVYALFWLNLSFFLFDLLTAPYGEAVAAAEADADFEDLDFFG